MPKSTRTSARSRTSKQSHLAAPTTRHTRSGHRTNRQQRSPLPAGEAVQNRYRPKTQEATFLPRTQYAINKDPNRQTRLLALPKEILQDIASQLPLVSIICLTLTCKEAAEAIGTESWARWKKEKQWVISGSIEILGKDWTDILECCLRCNTLHPPLKPARSHRETKLTKRCYGQDATIDYLPQDASNGYNLVFDHIAEAMEVSRDFSSKGDVGPLIEALSGSFTVTRANLLWSLNSSAQRIDGNLIIRHIHTIQSQFGSTVKAADFISLPIRLCPHQSTTTITPERSRYIKGKCAERNGRLLSQVITMEADTGREDAARLQYLRPLTPSEQKQVSAAKSGEDVYWRCRSCPTKYRTESRVDAFVVTSWHCLGRDLYHALKYWRWLVRRTGATLGPDKRNDEWWSPPRMVPDFVCQG